MKEPLTREEKEQLANAAINEQDLLADMLKNLSTVKRRIIDKLNTRDKQDEQMCLHFETLIIGAAQKYFIYRMSRGATHLEVGANFDAIMSKSQAEAPDEEKRKYAAICELIEKAVDDPIDAALGKKRDRPWKM